MTKIIPSHIRAIFPVHHNLSKLSTLNSSTSCTYRKFATTGHPCAVWLCIWLCYYTHEGIWHKTVTRSTTGDSQILVARERKMNFINESPYYGFPWYTLCYHRQPWASIKTTKLKKGIICFEWTGIEMHTPSCDDVNF